MVTVQKRLALILVVCVLSISGFHAQNGEQKPKTPVATLALEGKVLRQGTTEGVPDVHLMLARISPEMPQTLEADVAMQLLALRLWGDLGSPSNAEDQLSSLAKQFGISSVLLPPLQNSTVTSNSAGEFSFRDLAPGRYLFAAQRDGYLGVGPNGATLKMINQIVTLDATTVPLSLYMNWGGIINGIVTGPQGQPIANIDVVVHRADYTYGKRQWAPVARSSTNDRGEFRMISIPPGQYLIEAKPRPTPSRAAARPPFWRRTFYPAAIEPSEATMLTVNGEELKGIGIRLQAAEAQFNISGTAINPLPTVPVNPRTGVIDRSISTFYLVPSEPSGFRERIPQIFPNSSLPPALSNGAFEIRGVMPGRYELYAEYTDLNLRARFFSHASVDVRDQDVSGVSLVISPGANIETEIEVQGATASSVPLNSVHLIYHFLDDFPELFAPSRNEVISDGGRKRTNSYFPEAHYSFGLVGLPESAYIADMVQAGRSFYDDGVIVRQKNDPIRIIVNPAGGTLTGTVQAEDGSPARNTMVILIPPPGRRQNAQLFRLARTDASGRYSLTGIMPGTYSIIALQNLPAGDPWLAPEFLAKYLERADPINVNAGPSEFMPLKAITD